MEVAGPLTFVSSAAGAKRGLSCSPGFVDSTNRSHFAIGLDPSDEYAQQKLKRRRFNVDVSMDGESENSGHLPTFAMHNSHQPKNLFASSPDGEFHHGRCYFSTGLSLECHEINVVSLS